MKYSDRPNRKHVLRSSYHLDHKNQILKRTNITGTIGTCVLHVYFPFGNHFFRRIVCLSWPQSTTYFSLSSMSLSILFAMSLWVCFGYYQVMPEFSFGLKWIRHNCFLESSKGLKIVSKTTKY